MSMEHKAFAFNWAGFNQELGPILLSSLKSDAAAPLEVFIEKHLNDLYDPYEGAPLPVDWRALLETGDLQELADFALTKYYRPADDIGIGDQWLDLVEELSGAQQAALLGEPFGEDGCLFDPGRMGAYFQSPQRVADSVKLIQASEDERLAPFLAGLSDLIGTGKGVYVTF